jgi:NAD+ kinase
MHKIALVADQTSLANELKKKLLKKYNFIDLDSRQAFEHFDIVIVLGGDGFMLHSLHRFMNFDIKFYGINCGKVGFLLNSYNNEIDLYKKLEQSSTLAIYPLHMKALCADGSEKVKMAINEVYLARQSPQTAKIKIKVDHKIRMEEMSGDGIIVATAAGSSAYNFSVGGPIFPLESQILALTPIAPFRPKRWGGALLPSNSIIEFQILEADKRPVTAVADFLEVHNCIKLTVKEDRSRAIKLLFDSNHSLEDRILKEQFCF